MTFRSRFFTNYPITMVTSTHFSIRWAALTFSLAVPTLPLPLPTSTHRCQTHLLKEFILMCREVNADVRFLLSPPTSFFIWLIGLGLVAIPRLRSRIPLAWSTLHWLLWRFLIFYARCFQTHLARRYFLFCRWVSPMLIIRNVLWLPPGCHLAKNKLQMPFSHLEFSRPGRHF